MFILWVAGCCFKRARCNAALQRGRALLDRGARCLFPDLPDASSQWLGFRPSVPDSVPVIGRARGVPAAILAFGHGHLGLTLAAATADLVAAEVAGQADAQSLAACSPQRFSR